MVNKEKGKFWELMVDGSSNHRGVGVGIMLKSPNGKVFIQSLKLSFKALNNEAEYKALINGLKMSLAIRILEIRVLVAQQLNGGYEARKERNI